MELQLQHIGDRHVGQLYWLSQRHHWPTPYPAMFTSGSPWEVFAEPRLLERVLERAAMWNIDFWEIEGAMYWNLKPEVADELYGRA